MSEYTKHLTPRPELRERIIETAVKAFAAQGIKSITMDDIATSLGISKRTLYEVFPDKETLLEECIGSPVEMLPAQYRKVPCHQQEVF